MQGQNLIAGLRARAEQRGTVPPPPPPSFNEPAPIPDEPYVVERQERREPIADQLLRLARGILLLFLIAISMAVFCLVALLLGIF